MRSPETFDAYYVETRTRLLHEAYALTGDAPAARAAVRDAFVVAWHHWRKVAPARRPRRLRPPARPAAAPAGGTPPASGTATSRSTPRCAAPSTRCPSSPRASASCSCSTGSPRSPSPTSPAPSASPAADAERELQTATAQFALHRDVADHRDLAAAPRPRRAARGHPLAPRHRRPPLRRGATSYAHRDRGRAGHRRARWCPAPWSRPASGAEATSLGEEKATAGGHRRTPPWTTPPARRSSARTRCCRQPRSSRFGSGLDWKETATTDNLAGDGLLAPCQRERFADPDGVTALARTWEGSATRVVEPTTVGKGDGRARAKREVTDGRVDRRPDGRDVPRRRGRPRAASRPRRCGSPDASTRAPSCCRPARCKRVGDEARAFRLRSWGKQPATITVGMARTGSLVAHPRRPQPGQAPSRDKAVAHRARRRRQRASAGPRAPAPAPAAPAHRPQPPLDDRYAARAARRWSTCRRSPPSAAPGSAPTPSGRATTTPPPAATGPPSRARASARR